MDQRDKDARRAAPMTPRGGLAALAVAMCIFAAAGAEVIGSDQEPLDQKVAALIQRGDADIDKSNQVDLAVQDYDEAIRLRPDHREAFRHRARLYQATHRFDLAIKDRNDVIRLDPRDYIAFQLREDVYSGTNDDVHAIQDYTTVIELDSHPDPCVFQNRGEADVRLGRQAKADADFVKSQQGCQRFRLELSPSPPK